jgi:hypothetical protein
VDSGARYLQIASERVTSPIAADATMFRITRGITLDHAPSLPNPLLRFPNGTPIPIYIGDTADAAPEPAPPEDKPAKAES